MLLIEDQEFQTLVAYMRKNFGINLSQKRNLIEGRLGNHLQDSGFTSYKAYLDHVFNDHSELELSNLVNRLTTNHTFFMREANHFDYLKATVLPEMEQRLAKREIRIWSAGCSSGEEPYTLTMLMHEYFKHQKASWDTRILATDISAKVLSQARQGRYPSSSTDTLPEGWLNRYFVRAGDQWQINDKIKNEVVFRSLNLIQNSYPFKQKFHVIFCRNVMIYFEKATKVELVKRLYDLTEPGGYLFIGHAESIAREDTQYQYVQPAVYRKII